MQYTVTTRSGTHFEIADEYQRSLGQMTVSSWRPAKARINTTDSSIYDISSTGFWQTEKMITRNGIHFGKIKPKLGTGIAIIFDNGRSYLLRRKSFWSSGDYLLINESGEALGSVRSWFSWKNWSFQYDVQLNDSMLDKDLHGVLPFILIYCVRLTRIRQAG